MNTDAVLRSLEGPRDLVATAAVAAVWSAVVWLLPLASMPFVACLLAPVVLLCLLGLVVAPALIGSNRCGPARATGGAVAMLAGGALNVAAVVQFNGAAQTIARIYPRGVVGWWDGGGGGGAGGGAVAAAVRAVRGGPGDRPRAADRVGGARCSAVGRGRSGDLGLVPALLHPLQGPVRRMIYATLVFGTAWARPTVDQAEQYLTWYVAGDTDRLWDAGSDLYRDRICQGERAHCPRLPAIPPRGERIRKTVRCPSRIWCTYERIDRYDATPHPRQRCDPGPLGRGDKRTGPVPRRLLPPLRARRNLWILKALLGIGSALVTTFALIWFGLFALLRINDAQNSRAHSPRASAHPIP